MNAEKTLAELKEWLTEREIEGGHPGTGAALDKIAELEAAEERVCGWCREIEVDGAGTGRDWCSRFKTPVCLTDAPLPVCQQHRHGFRDRRSGKDRRR